MAVLVRIHTLRSLDEGQVGQVARAWPISSTISKSNSPESRAPR
jgi:hypothetical protein